MFNVELLGLGFWTNEILLWLWVRLLNTTLGIETKPSTKLPVTRSFYCMMFQLYLFYYMVLYLFYS